jgi:hypothetical protein
MQYSSQFDPYWTHNVMIGEGVVEKHKSLIRLHMHRSEETYEHSIDELFPFTTRRGNRSYFLAKPYILLPQMTLTFGVTKPKADSDAIGRVIGSDVTKLQEREIGNAQAWYYPAEKALVLWECYLHQPYRQEDPRKDHLLTTIWQGFEKTLLKELPDTTKVYTLYEPYYDRPVYKTFLAKLGYRPIENATFVKEVT